MKVDNSVKTREAFYRMYSALMHQRHHKDADILTEDELVRRINGMADEEELVITPVGGGK